MTTAKITRHRRPGLVLGVILALTLVVPVQAAARRTHEFVQARGTWGFMAGLVCGEDKSGCVHWVVNVFDGRLQGPDVRRAERVQRACVQRIGPDQVREDGLVIGYDFGCAALPSGGFNVAADLSSATVAPVIIPLRPCTVDPGSGAVDCDAAAAPELLAVTSITWRDAIPLDPDRTRQTRDDGTCRVFWANFLVRSQGEAALVLADGRTIIGYGDLTRGSYTLRDRCWAW